MFNIRPMGEHSSIGLFDVDTSFLSCRHHCLPLYPSSCDMAILFIQIRLPHSPATSPNGNGPAAIQLTLIRWNTMRSLVSRKAVSSGTATLSMHSRKAASTTTPTETFSPSRGQEKTARQSTT